MQTHHDSAHDSSLPAGIGPGDADSATASPPPQPPRPPAATASQPAPPQPPPPRPSALPRTLPLEHIDDVVLFSAEVTEAAERRGRLLLPEVAPMLNEASHVVASGVGAALRTLREATCAVALENWGAWTPEARATRWALGGRAEMGL